MRTIWKYDVPITDKLEIRMPIGWRFVAVGLDPRNRPCMWVEVDTEATSIKHQFSVVGTGHPIHEDARVLGSIRQDPFMWHVCLLEDVPF